MSTSADNVISLADFRNASTRELIDDVSARAFLFLRDEAAALNLPMQAVIAEHMLGMALVVEAVEGTEAAKTLLAMVGEKLG